MEDFLHSTPVYLDDVDPFAWFGGCSSKYSSYVDCTLTPEVDCTESNDPFVSGLELRNQNHEDYFEMFPVDKETCEAQDLPSTRCAPDASKSVGACTIGGCIDDSASSNDNDDSCNLVMDRKTQIATLYGACKDTSTKEGSISGCFWSSDDCHHVSTTSKALFVEQWLTPDEYVQELWRMDQMGIANNNNIDDAIEKGYCDCSDVQIGACRTGNTGLFVCAVDEKQCSGKDQTFVSARTLLDHPETYGDVHCRLCPENLVDGFVETSTRAFVQNSEFFKNLKLKTGMSSSSSSDDTSKSIDPDGDVVAAIVVGSLLGLALLFATILFIQRMCCGGIDTKYQGEGEEEVIDGQSPSTSTTPAEGRSID